MTAEGGGRGSGPGRLLAVHAHPDDETLATGALLATWAAAGGTVDVVTCTRGERGEVIGAELAHLEGDGPALAAHRETELATALAALGVTEHAFLDTLPDDEPDDGAPTRFTDSGMAWLDPARPTAAVPPDALPAGAFVASGPGAARRLAAHVRRTRPDVVVTYEPGGGYGHPDHVRAHDVTHEAMVLAAVPAPVVLWAVAEAGALRAARAELTGVSGDVGHLRLPADDDPLPSAAAHRPDLVVDVAPVLDRVLTALRAHATQVQAVARLARPGHALARLALSNDVLAPVVAHEAYRVVAGDPAAVAWPAGVAPVA